MLPTVTRDATNNYQAPANWDVEKYGPCGDLQVRRDVFVGNERGLIECVSTWKPSAAELAHLNAGGVIEVGLIQVDQCAIRVYVVDPVEAALLPYVPHQLEDGITINEDTERGVSHG